MGSPAAQIVEMHAFQFDPLQLLPLEASGKTGKLLYQLISMKYPPFSTPVNTAKERINEAFLLYHSTGTKSTIKCLFTLKIFPPSLLKLLNMVIIS